MEEKEESLTQYVVTMLREGKTREDIELYLLEKGHDEKFARELVKEAQKLHYAIRRSQGLTLILVGAVICFSSFLITITSSFSHNSFPWVLYGLTSVGILVAFTGFTKVF